MDEDEKRGSRSGPWRIERLLDDSDEGPEILELHHVDREGRIAFPRDEAAELVIALCHYLGVTRIESSSAT